jgi:hypothetical protein
MIATPVTTKPSSIASRLRSYGVVYAALTTQSPEATTVLAARRATMLAADSPADEPVLDASEDTTYRELFDHLAHELEMAKTGMISANSTHLGQLAQIVDLKSQRDGQTGNLSGRFFKTRHTFETLYGSDQRFAVLAISGDTPDDPTGLVAQVRETVGFLEDPKVATPDLDVLGIEIDPATLATQLTADADVLDGVLDGLNRAQKQADVTREAKNVAIKAYDDKFMDVARVAESVFRFAGLYELAKRVRPSTRRPGRRLEEENGETDATDTQPIEADGQEPVAQPAEPRPDASAQPDVPAAPDVTAEPDAQQVDG